MGRFIEGQDRRQATLLPDCLDDYVAKDNPVRVLRCSMARPRGPWFCGCRRRKQRVGPPIIRRRCSRSTSTAISTASNPAVGWSARRSAT